MRQAEEGTRLLSNVCEVDEAERFPDDVEKVAMFAGGGVGPFARWSLRCVTQAHEHGAACGITSIANLPVVALPVAVGEIVAADRLGLAAETVCQFRSVLPSHHAASRSLIRSTG